MKTTKRSALALVCSICLVGAGVAGLPGANAQEVDTLNLSYPESNAYYWNLGVARDKGFFSDEGFKVNYVTSGATPQIIQMLISGDLNLVTPQPDALFVAIARGGKDLRIFAQPALSPDWILVGKKGLKDIKEAKGLHLGVSALGGSEQTLAQQVLAEHGLKKGDYNVIVSGLTPTKYAALQTGSIALAVLYQPTAQLALQQGFPDLYRFTKYQPVYPPSYYVVNQKWAAEKDRGKRVSRVIARAHEWLWDPKNRDEAIKILQKYTKRDAALLGEIYDQYFVKDKLYSPDGKVRLRGVQTILDALIERGDLKKGQLTPDQIVLPAEIGGLITPQ